MKTKNIILLIALFIAFQGKSMAFTNTGRINTGENTFFKYEWLSKDNKLSEIIFSLNNEQSKNFNIFNHQSSLAVDNRKEIELEMNKRASFGIFTITLDPNFVINIDYPNEYHGSKKLEQSIIKSKEVLYANINKSTTIVNVNNNHMLNYKTLVENNIPLTKSIANAFKLKHSRTHPRIAINDLLAFYQSIPYDELKTSEYGFINTNEMILKNKGDCDSKSVSFISTLKNMYPNIKTIIVVIDKHAFVGLNINSTPNDRTITYGKTKYVLAEPVGEAKHLLGEISKSSNIELVNNRFKIFVM